MCVKNGSYVGVKFIQLIVAPLMIAPLVKNIIGVVMFESSSLICWIGNLLDLPHAVVSINRVEYAAVKAVARRNIIMIKVLVGENKQNSMIRSFE